MVTTEDNALYYTHTTSVHGLTSQLLRSFIINCLSFYLSVNPNRIHNKKMQIIYSPVPDHVCSYFQNETGYSCDKVKFCEEVFTILRVKDPLAALWPFLGIVAEVIRIFKSGFFLKCIPVLVMKYRCGFDFAERKLG